MKNQSFLFVPFQDKASNTIASINKSKITNTRKPKIQFKIYLKFALIEF
jgi:hypothetical protein